jgi:hypothetical protein
MSGGNAVDDSIHPGQPNDAVAVSAMDQSPHPQPSEDIAAASPPAAATAQPSESQIAGQPDIPSSTATKENDAGDAADTDADTTAGPPPPLKERSDSGMAIGPAQDDINVIASNGSDGPVCNITLLLTTGSRHPYKLDGKYLSRRNVKIPEQTETGQPDPFSISIYTLKELILREWRSDWETKPASPSSIRLIHFGKLLDDKEPLRKYQFSTESPNVVHMSIRPQDLDEEEPKSGGKHQSSSGGDGQRTRSGGCCVIL